MYLVSFLHFNLKVYLKYQVMQFTFWLLLALWEKILFELEDLRATNTAFTKMCSMEPWPWEIFCQEEMDDGSKKFDKCCKLFILGVHKIGSKTKFTGLHTP